MSENNKISQAVVLAADKTVSGAQDFTGQDRIDYLEMLGCAAIHVMRLYAGDDYTRGWLEHALSDLDKPAMFELRRPS